MAEQRYDDMPRRDDDTNAPQNPPNAVLNKGARRAAVWSYFVPVVALFVIIGVAMIYWLGRAQPTASDDRVREEIGTVGRPDGGFDPRPQPGNTREEIENRGDDLSPITRVGDLPDTDARTMNGRQVSIEEAEVDSVDGTTIWIRDGDAKFAVLAPAGTGAFSPGSKVSITGHIQVDERGAPMIRAERVQAK